MAAPAYDVDFYSDDVIRNPWPHYAAMRALGALVWLPQHGNYAVTRYAEVAACLRDPVTFCSGRGVAADETACAIMRGNSIASDGERHKAIRAAMATPLLPGALSQIRPLLDALSEDLIENLLQRGEFEAMGELAAHLPLTVVRDLVGLPDFGKANMLRWAAAAFDLLGVQNARGRKALGIFLEQKEFVAQHATRESLGAGSWTRRLHELVDEGGLAPELAPYCIRDYINPSLDTTISATGHLIWQLASHADQWHLLRARPELLMNAVNEAVRLAAPIRSFCRHATRDVPFGEWMVEKDARVMVLYASANRDERAFPDPDRFDITRNPRLHLGFGSGIHMCVGMHLAQMEMAALLTAMLSRVERIECGDPQPALNNTIHSFVSLPTRFWPVAARRKQHSNTGVSVRTSQPSTAPRLVRAKVVERRQIAPESICLTLEPSDGEVFAEWQAGAHIDIHIRPGLVRQYSLTGPYEPGRYRIAVQKEPASRGGSVAMHAKYSVGSDIVCGGPRNNFRMAETAGYSVLLSGGIGMTPILAMAWRLHELQRPFEWHLAARTLARLPFREELQLLPFADRMSIHVDDAADTPALDVATIVQSAAKHTHFYVCGPRPYMERIQAIARAGGVGDDHFHLEHFGAEIDPDGEPFTVVAELSGRVVEVGRGETILAALRREGIYVETACQNGVCGTCVTEVTEGRPDHRDLILTDAEKAANQRIAVCCSRSRTKVLRLRV